VISERARTRTHIHTHARFVTRDIIAASCLVRHLLFQYCVSPCSASKCSVSVRPLLVQCPCFCEGHLLIQAKNARPLAQVGIAAGAAMGALVGSYIGKKWGKKEIRDIDEVGSLRLTL
jgi:hypothetical protein